MRTGAPGKNRNKRYDNRNSVKKHKQIYENKGSDKQQKQL
jgi:hypothetical protein